MANYRLVTNAQFRPFSFEEYIKPYEMYGEAYKEIEQNIIDLEELAGKWDKLANELTDPKTHATYKAYADELRALADLLSRYGMSPQLRRRTATMRGRYAKDIVPIETQYNRRELLRELLHLLQVQNGNSLRFDNDFLNVSLDDMINNPSMTYLMVSGNQITAEVANEVIAKAKGKGIHIRMDDLDNGTKNKKGESIYKTNTQTSGYTLLEVEDVIAGRGGPEELQNIYNEVKEKYKDNPAYDETWARPYIDAGIRLGILGQEASVMQDVNVWTDPDLEKFDEQKREFNVEQATIRRGQDMLRLAQREALLADMLKTKWTLQMLGFKIDSNNNIVPMSAEDRAKFLNNYTRTVNLAKNGIPRIQIKRGAKRKDGTYSRTLTARSLMSLADAQKFTLEHQGRFYTYDVVQSESERGVSAVSKGIRTQLGNVIYNMGNSGADAKMFYYWISDEYDKDGNKIILAFPYDELNIQVK